MARPHSIRKDGAFVTAVGNRGRSSKPEKSLAFPEIYLQHHMRIPSFFMNLRYLTFLLVPIVLAGCQGDPPGDAGSGSPPSPDEELEIRATGEAASEALVTTLGSQLKGALQSGGPVAAISFCKEVAIPMTEATSGRFAGVTIRRTTLQPRNPANAPDATDREILEQWIAEMGEKEEAPEPRVIWEDGTARYYRPLLIAEVCLNCHGDASGFPPELASILAESYPEDEATGYALGDLRGAIRVDITRR